LILNARRIIADDLKKKKSYKVKYWRNWIFKKKRSFQFILVSGIFRLLTCDDNVICFIWERALSEEDVKNLERLEHDARKL
jgi:hypothetical protein